LDKLEFYDNLILGRQYKVKCESDMHPSSYS